MSFILEALKKSENARQRQIGPSRTELPRRRTQSERPWWAFLVAGLLLVNVGILTLVLTRKKSDIEPVTSAAAAVNNAPAALPVDSPVSLQARIPLEQDEPQLPSRGRAGGSLAEEASLPNELDGDGSLQDIGQAMLQAPPVAEQPAVRPIQAPAVTPLASAPPLPAAAPARNASPAEVLPTVDELAASGRTFPPMRLDIHVYGDTPAERFVFVNMRKYGEGQALQEGPQIERITVEGVILNQQGLRFILPRQ